MRVVGMFVAATMGAMVAAAERLVGFGARAGRPSPGCAASASSVLQLLAAATSFHGPPGTVRIRGSVVKLGNRGLRIISLLCTLIERLTSDVERVLSSMPPPPRMCKFAKFKWPRAGRPSAEGRRTSTATATCKTPPLRLLAAGTLHAPPGPPQRAPLVRMYRLPCSCHPPLIPDSRPRARAAAIGWWQGHRRRGGRSEGSRVTDRATVQCRQKS